jgi:hypothetical protein
MIEQFGESLAFQHQKTFESLEVKHKKIKEYREGNKNTAIQAFKRILEILEYTKENYDMSQALA